MNNFYIFSNVQKNEDSKLGFELCLYGGKEIIGLKKEGGCIKLILWTRKKIFLVQESKTASM